jgi:putative tricarboxylic transport membrane protein
MSYKVISGLLLTLVGAGASLLAYRLGLGNFREPGPGLIPFGTAALFCLMCIGLVVKSLIEGRSVSQRTAVFQGIKWGTLIFVVCALLGYGVALNTLGFSISTFLFIVLLLGVVGRRKWWVTLVSSILIVIGIYLTFVAWLGCEFPRGFLGI